MKKIKSIISYIKLKWLIVGFIFLPITLLGIGCYLVISGINLGKIKRAILGLILITVLIINFISSNSTF